MHDCNKNSKWLRIASLNMKKLSRLRKMPKKLRERDLQKSWRKVSRRFLERLTHLL